MVEQLICNQQVAGSTPVPGSMKTHTVRLSGSKLERIYTFSKGMMELLRESHPNAIPVFFAKMKSEGKKITGMTHSITYEQLEELDKIHKPRVIEDPDLSMIETSFINGLLQKGPIDAVVLLRVINTFYYMCLRYASGKARGFSPGMKVSQHGNS